MWIIVLLITLGTGFFIFKRAIDSETQKNISFLFKTLLFIFSVILLFVLSLTVLN